MNMIDLYKAIRYSVLYSALKLKSFKYNNAIVICSYPRSGSTWLMELINTLPNTIINWEPLHVKKGVVPDELFLGEKPYLRETESNKSYQKLFSKIFEFKLR